ncbi:TcdA/TcdB pore-forming domain-containing protein [Aeromonas veronii]
MISFEKKIEKTKSIFNKYKGYIPEDIYKESQKRINEAEISNKKNGNGGELLVKLSDYISESIKKDSSNEFKKFSVIFSKRTRDVSDFEGQANIVEKMKDLNLGGFSNGICVGLVLLHDLNIKFDDGESINKKVSKVFETKNVSLQKTLSDLLCSAQVKALTRQLTKADLLNYFPEGLKEDFITTFDRFLVETVVKNLMDKEFTKSKKISLAISFKNPKSGEQFAHAVSLQWVDESGWIYYDPNHGEFTFSTKEALLGFIESSYRHFNVSLIGAFLSGTSSNLYGKEFLAEIESDFNKIKGKINEAAKDFDNSLGEDGDVIEWRKPSREAFESILQDFIEDKKATKYRKNIILQLQSEEVVNNSVLNLLGKHPEQSALLQLDPDNKSLNVLLWDNETKDFRISSIADWLTLDSEGMIRIQLVGHGDTKEGKTTLGGLDVAQLQQAIHPVLELLAKSGPHLKGLKISLVGCETLLAGGALEQSLPAQLLQFIHNQLQQLELKDVPLQLTGRELQIQVNNDGHKLVNIDGKWVSKEVANLLGKQHKTTLVMQDGQVVVQAKSKGEVLALIEGMQAIKEPLSADDTALLEKIGASLQENIREVSGERHEQQTTQLLIQLDELLQLKGEVNDIFDLLQKDPELKGLKPTLELDKAGKLLWIGANGEKKYIVLEHEHYGKLERLASKTQQLLSEFQQHVSLDESGNISLKHDGQIALEQVEGGPATLNAAFLLQTLLGENPFNHGLDNVTVAMKIQTYAQLIQNSMGVVHDVEKVVELYMQAVKADFNLASKLIGVSNTFGSIGGVVLDLVNMGASLAQVFQAKDDYEKSQAITNLVGNLIPTGINTAALVAGLAGASSAASILGMVGVPIAGLAAGLLPLINIEGGYVHAFEEAKKLFTQILNDYQDISVTKLNAIFGGSLVISGVNFNKGEVTLGEALTGWNPKGLVDIYGGLGSHSSGTSISNEAIAIAESFVLPSNLNATYYWTPAYMLVGSYDSCDAFDRLHNKYNGNFEGIKHYGGGQKDILNVRKVIYRDTEIRIDLDDNTRNMSMPIIEDKNHRSKLHYQLVGGGGSYTLALSHLPIDIKITASNSLKESWILDVEHLIKDVNINKDGQVKVAEYLFSDLAHQIDINSERLVIGGQKIDFDGEYRPKDLYLTSVLTMLSPAGGPVINPFSSDNTPLSGRLVMQVDLVSKQIVQYAVSFNSAGEAAASLGHLKQTLSPLVKTGLISLSLKTGQAHGVFDIDNNRSVFLCEETGILTYFSNGNLAKLKVFREHNQLSEQVLGGRESGQIYYGKDGIYLTRNLIIANLDKATVISKVGLDDNGGIYFQTETLSLSSKSLPIFEQWVLRNEEPLVGLAKLLEPAKAVDITGKESIIIESQLGQKMVFEYALIQQRKYMQLKSAIWKTSSDVVLSYKLLPDSAYINVQGKQGSRELVLKDEEIRLDYASADTIMVINAPKSIHKISLPVSANKYKKIVINGVGDNLTLNVGGVRSNNYGLMWDGQDLIICTDEQPQVRITKAWDIKTLQLGISDSLFTVDKLSCWARQQQLHNTITSQFGVEKTYGEYEIGSVRYFYGESGVHYKMIDKECTAIGYSGTEAMILPKNGIRSLDLLKKILDGKTLFSGKGIWNISMDVLFPEKGQAALDMLGLLESGNIHDVEKVKAHILKGIQSYKQKFDPEGTMGLLSYHSEDLLVNEAFDRSKNLVPYKDIPCLQQSGPIAGWGGTASYHLDKLVMAMNSLVSSEKTGELSGMLGGSDVRGGEQLTLVR